MKILFITPRLYYGGAETQMRRLIKIGIDLNHEIEVLDIESNNNLEEKYKIYQLKENILLDNDNRIIRNIKRMKIYFLINKIIKKEKYDYIIFFYILLLPIVFFSKNKFILSIREYNINYFKKFSIFLKKLFFITTNNVPTFIELQKKYNNIFLQNNILDFTVKDLTKDKLGNKIYLVVSNISKRKNILPVIKVFKKLEKDGYKLKIAGKIVEENYYKEIKKESENYKNISFLGYLNKNELENEYIKAEGIIHLSKLEGTPNAILDAIIYKKKFICLNTPENICLFSEAKEFIISNESELENKVKEITGKNYPEILNYLNKKMELLFNEENGKKFYIKLEEILKLEER